MGGAHSAQFCQLTPLTRVNSATFAVTSIRPRRSAGRPAVSWTATELQPTPAMEAPAPTLSGQAWAMVALSIQTAFS
jgi:hypothetical protein